MEGQKTANPTGFLEHVQHHHFTRALQGLLPAKVQPHKLRQVLDVNCHTGVWAIELAQEFPSLTVTALDRDPHAIELARHNAQMGNVAHVHFFEADLHMPLKLADETFDFVHLFISHPLFRPSEWPAFLQECLRVMQPKGYINLVNVSLGASSSDAYQQLLLLADRFSHTLGYTFSDKPGTLGPGIYFCRLLRQAGFHDISYVIRPVNLGGWNNSSGRACCQLFINDIARMKTLLVKHNLISHQEIDVLIARSRKDITEVDFCATAALISTLAVKKL